MRNENSSCDGGVLSSYPQVAGPRKKLPILVEADSHHSIGSVECFFYSIAVVYVNVNVKNPRVVSSRYS